MEVQEAIARRRAYRSLAPVVIPDDLILDLARQARLAPSCNNNQPWRFVFVRDPAKLAELHAALNSPGNDWARTASMIVAVFSRREDDCLIKEREYHLFDTGMASAFLILRATELGLVAHPIAGFSPKKTREVLGIPEPFQVITLINIGVKSAGINPGLSPKQVEQETTRPARRPLGDFAFLDGFGRPISEA
ncbi:MAG: nitroreductase [Candidatus Aminicenantes bacterium]|nr:nitroreductase [Candidatus Aminicenantes bacterium]